MNVANDFDWLAIGTLIVAIIALLRPEIVNAVSRWTNEIDFYPATRFEIGFSDFGPTVGIHGSVRSIGNDQLIKSIAVQVTRLAPCPHPHIPTGSTASAGRDKQDSGGMIRHRNTP